MKTAILLQSVFGEIGSTPGQIFTFSPPFLTGGPTRYLIGPSIRRLIGFPYLIAH
ncbi:hypothetical protein T08_3206 [Trichinella sp. T8]|nr:hypothetical protein T08_3206 [Trichinella sp. T8]